MDDELALAKALLRQHSTLRAEPSLTSLGSGRSGARTLRVDARDQAFALKVHPQGYPQAAWRRSLRIAQLAGARGLTPTPRAWDEGARAVLSDFIAASSLLEAMFDPARQTATLTSLAATLASLHSLDLEELGPPRRPLYQARKTLDEVGTRLQLPRFALEVLADAEKNEQPAGELSLCHLDLNPLNLLYEAGRVWLIDWDTAGPGDRWLDLATVANLLLFDAQRTEHWIELYCHAARVPPPSAPMFAAARRTAYAGYGCAFLGLLTRLPLESPPFEPTLARCYRALRQGQLTLDNDLGRYCLSAANFAAYWEAQ